MAIYEYQCGTCDAEFEKILPMSQSDVPQDCPECGKGPAKRRITGGMGFILKGDGWEGKNIKIAGQMQRKNAVLTKKQEEKSRDAGIRLVPNVGGEKVDSWSEAGRMASSQGKDASGYEDRARTEKK